MPRGINSAGDVVQKLADGADANALFNEFGRAAAAQNAKRDGLAALLSFKTSKYGEPVGYRALPLALAVAYSFKWRDIGVRTTWRFLIDATAEQVRANTNGVLEADNRQCFDGIMGAFLDPAARVSPEGKTVYGLYNADGTVPPEVDGVTFLGTHTHYLTSGAANFDGADLFTLMGHVTTTATAPMATGAAGVRAPRRRGDDPRVPCGERQPRRLHPLGGCPGVPVR